MDHRTFMHTARALVAQLEGSLEPNWITAIRESLDHGEEGMAVDQLLRVLIKHEIPVRPAQRDTLYELIDYFGPLDDKLLHYVPNLMTSSIDWLTVVGE